MYQFEVEIENIRVIVQDGLFSSNSFTSDDDVTTQTIVESRKISILDSSATVLSFCVVNVQGRLSIPITIPADHKAES